MLNRQQIREISHEADDRFLSCSTIGDVVKIKELLKCIPYRKKMQFSIFTTEESRKKFTNILKELGYSFKVITEGATYYLILNAPKLEDIKPIMFDPKMLTL